MSPSVNGVRFLSGASRQVSFLFLCALAIGVGLIPVVHVPLSWFETLFHEDSHALVTALTGGHVQRVILNFDGSGLTWGSGGWRIPVTFAGYAGAMLWGAFLYVLATMVSDRTARVLVAVMLTLGALEAVTWLAFSVSSWVILLTLLAIVALLAWRPAGPYVRPALRFIGIYVLLSGLHSITYLWNPSITKSDALDLQHLTWVPALVWIGLWLLMGAGLLTTLFLRERRLDRQGR
jgi:hypothetical protein